MRVSIPGVHRCDSAAVTRLLTTRTQVVLLVVALAAAVGVLGAVAWVTSSARAAALVSASWTLDCPDARLGEHEGRPAIWSRPGWRCEVDLQVVNDSGREVRVTAVSARMVGLEGPHEVRSLPSMTSALALPRNDTDARWVADVRIPAHGTRTVTVAIGWREEGCNGNGYVILDPWATVHFETLERSHEVTAPEPLVLRTFDDKHDAQACPDD